MSEDKRWQFELEEYIRQGEPEQAEKSEAWQIAIGLQQVDGLKISAYLLDTAKEHIEGKISIDETQKRIQSTMKKELIEKKLRMKQKRLILFLQESHSFWVRKHSSFHQQNG